MLHHKTRLGQCTRDTPSLLEEGVNIEVVWSTNVKLLLFSNHTLETIGLSCMLQPMKMGHMWQLLGDKALFSTISRAKDGEFLGILIKNEKFSIGLVWLGRIIVLYNYREATKMRVVLFHCYGLFLILGQSRSISVYVVNIM